MMENRDMYRFRLDRFFISEELNDIFRIISKELRKLIINYFFAHVENFTPFVIEIEREVLIETILKSISGRKGVLIKVFSSLDKLQIETMSKFN